MKSKNSQIDSLPEIYKKPISMLNTEALEMIFQNRSKALEYASKGIMQTEPEKLNDEYIALIADSMQVLARIVLDERGISTQS